MADIDVLTVQFTDANGDTGLTRVKILQSANDATAVGLVGDLAAVSALQLQKAQRTRIAEYTDDPAESLADEKYADDREMLVMSFGVGSNGQHVYIGIPGPLEALIQENNLRIDPANAAFNAIKAAVAAAVTTDEGTAVAGSLERGILNTSRTTRAA